MNEKWMQQLGLSILLLTYCVFNIFLPLTWKFGFKVLETIEWLATPVSEKTEKKKKRKKKKKKVIIIRRVRNSTDVCYERKEVE